MVSDFYCCVRALLFASVLLLANSCAVTPPAELIPPRVISPSVLAISATAPSDAMLLFTGNDLSNWQKNLTGKDPTWRLKDEYVEVRRFAGDMSSREAFGDVQLHIEWAIPKSVSGRGQHRGNSGIKFMGRYEVQILDSYNNTTYPAGQAGAIYSQHPPLVNASRPAGVWQSFDIIFSRPRFDKKGEIQKPAYFTIWHNGILIQNHVEVHGPTKGNPGYQPHTNELPLTLQNHRSKVRFRNIWIRRLE